MEAREEVDSTDDPAILSALLARNRQKQEDLVQALSAAFRSDDTRAAVALTNQLQYLAKLEHEIVKKLPQL
jgi:molecular chaperone HscB